MVRARITRPDDPDRHFAIEAEGRHIGNCELPKKHGDVGIVIGDRTAWNKGYGTAVIQELLRRAFTEMDFYRVSLAVFADNQRGLRCYEKCGFRREGFRRKAYLKEGRYHDVIPMAILREEWEARREAPERRGGDVTIRSYRRADYPQVVALWELTGFAPLGPNDEAASIEWKLATQPGFFLVAVADGQIVGTTVGSLERRWGWLQRVAVHPDYQRRGIAKQLMGRAEEAHAALGAFRTVLMTGEATSPRGRLRGSRLQPTGSR